MTIAIYIFAAFCASSVLVKFIGIVQVWWFRYREYPRLRRQMDPSFRPLVHVFLPCKGSEPGFDENLDALATLDYPDYQVVCITESEDDDAVGAIEAAMVRHPGRFERVVAGIATRCGQKNHNLLAAIDAHGDAEIYLFCDAKVRPDTDWIVRMVEPFSLKRKRPILSVTAVCSGGRFSDWRLPHMFQQQVATWQTVALACYVGGVWGSSMAFRRKDWESLGLREIWAETIVDDVTTSSRLFREGPGRMFAALDAHPNPGYSMSTMAQAFDWGVRQNIYVRYCLPQYWVPTLFQNVLGIATFAWPLAFVAESGTTWHLFGLVSLAAFLPCLIANVTMKPVAGIELPWGRFLLLAPLWDVIWMVLTLAASQEDGVAWRGIHYDLDAYGRVLSITRDDVDLLPAEAEAAEEGAATKAAKVTA